EIGKGQKKNTTSISTKLYEQICELKELNKNSNWKDSEIVFQISENAVNDMMKRLREILNIDPSRRIKFHSLRGVAIDFALTDTGDVRKAAVHANHSGIDTMYKHYLNKTKDYTQTPGIKMEEEVDLSFLDEMTNEDFKKFFNNSERR